MKRRCLALCILPALLISSILNFIYFSRISNEVSDPLLLPEPSNLSRHWLRSAEDLVKRRTSAKGDNVELLIQNDTTRSTRNITLVSVLLDIGRGSVSTFSFRSFDEYIRRTERFLQYDFPKILFVDSTKQLNTSQAQQLHLIPVDPSVLRSIPLYPAIQAIRNSPAWKTQASWLSESAQSVLELYNPLVMSKMSWLREAAALDPFHTDTFLFVDAAHHCHTPHEITKKYEKAILQQYLPTDKLFVTGFDYQPHSGEIHGFDERSFRSYLGLNPLGKEDLAVVRGGIFGGQKHVIELVDDVLQIMMEETLSKGFMGTEENILSMLYYRFPQLVSYFDIADNGACAAFEAFADTIPTRLNLRGLECATELDGSYVCYHSRRSRQYCPSHVTPAYLTRAEGHKCDGETFCTVKCKSDGSVLWSPHLKLLCQTSPGACPLEPQLQPSNWVPPKHLERDHEVPRCRQQAGSQWRSPNQYFGSSPSELVSFVNSYNDTQRISGLTVLMLVMNTESEYRAAESTLETYEAHGLLAGVNELIIWVNGIKAVDPIPFQKYTSVFNIRVEGSPTNIGQTRAINALVDLSSNDHVLFLEKDFRLVEPWPCVVDQLTSGQTLLRKGQAHFVKYRHRWRPGHPNWAAKLFRGQEDQVFEQQINLACYHYHWLEDPIERFPQVFRSCAADNETYMYCSDSAYCGFTLNPILFSRNFWQNQYVQGFNHFKLHDPNENLEYYMNWEPYVWNEKGWTIAQGEGLFEHVDEEKWGV